MEVGAQAQTVTVTAAPPMLDKTDATLGATMENETFAALPILINSGQRDPTSFASLMPGVQGGARGGYQRKRAAGREASSVVSCPAGSARRDRPHSEPHHCSRPLPRVAAIDKGRP